MPNQMLSVKDSRVEKNIRTYPSSVKINAKKRASLISKNNSIYIKHWYDSEYEVSSQICRLIWNEKLKHSLKHMWALWLTWVHPWCDDYSLFVKVITDVGSHFQTKLIVSTPKQGSISYCIMSVINSFKNISIVFIERINLFFKRCFKQLAYLPLWFKTLFQKLLWLDILLVQLFPQQVRQFFVKLHRVVVILVCIDVFSNSNHRAWCPSQFLA